MAFVKKFKKFQSTERVGEVDENKETVNETVVLRDNKFIVNGISVNKSFISAYKSKVDKQTGKRLNQTFSDDQIAEELVKYIIDKHGEVDMIPVSALLGGEEGMEDEIEDVSMEEPAEEVSDDSVELSGDDLEEKEEEEEEEEEDTAPEEELEDPLDKGSEDDEKDEIDDLFSDKKKEDDEDRLPLAS